MASLNKTLRVLVVTVVGGAVLVSAAYLLRRSSCATDAQAVAGMERVERGKRLYFDGRCWTSTALPPRDTPF